MNTDQLEGRWTYFRGKVKERWGKLTNDHLDRLNGRWDQLVGLIQEQYGDAREDIERQVQEFRRTYETEQDRNAGR